MDTLHSRIKDIYFKLFPLKLFAEKWILMTAVTDSLFTEC